MAKTPAPDPEPAALGRFPANIYAQSSGGRDLATGLVMAVSARSGKDLDRHGGDVVIGVPIERGGDQPLGRGRLIGGTQEGQHFRFPARFSTRRRCTAKTNALPEPVGDLVELQRGKIGAHRAGDDVGSRVGQRVLGADRAGIDQFLH
jgi:hypothetical protein